MPARPWSRIEFGSAGGVLEFFAAAGPSGLRCGKPEPPMSASPITGPTTIDPLPAALRALAARGEPRRYRKGVLLIQEGDRGDTLYIVLSGSVKAYSVDERDREIVYGIYEAGQYFGEMSFDGGPRSASVITLEPTQCVAVTRQALRAHIAADPDFALELLGRVISRAREATRIARDLAFLGVYERLVRLFDGLADPAAADGTRLLPRRLTHQEIANRICASREMVTRILKDLQTGGFVVPEGAGWRLPKALPQRW
jgi:CRP/FNR family cyclic AMP-dependent transcriptional regulator